MQAESSLYRSETMQYVQLLVSEVSAVETLQRLGHFGKLHLVELPSPTEAQAEEYTSKKRRVALCDTWERRLNELRAEMVRNNVLVPGPEVKAVDKQYSDVLEELKGWLDPLMEQFEQHMTYKKQTTQVISERKEHEWVLRLCDKSRIRRSAESDEEKGSGGYGSFESKHRDSRREEKEMSEPFLTGGQPTEGGFSSTICGVVSADRKVLFERMIFRISRGNAVMTFREIPEPIVDPATGLSMRKEVYTVMFMGTQLKQRIMRTTTAFAASRYSVPADSKEQKAKLDELRNDREDREVVLNKTNEELRSLLRSIAFDPIPRGSELEPTSPLVNWLSAVRQEKAICEALRKCLLPTHDSKVITIEGWLPIEEVPRLRVELVDAVRRSQNPAAVLNLKHGVASSPPTYFKLNKFTAPYQSIVDTYGVPRYKEVNPGLFTIITFPFLFGVMYGDIGHGLMLWLFATLLIWKEDQLTAMVKAGTLGEIPAMAFGGRYVLFLMGAFAFYCGTIYNDCMSIPINLFGSTFTFPSDESGAAATWDGHAYAYGVDPHWYHSSNQLAFMNSMKMKLSVTLGVAQMTFGIFLSLSNHLYHGDMLGVFFEFVPRLVFMLSTFGYMIFLIVYKFTVDWPNRPDLDPPNLVQTMIAMFLSPGSVEERKQLYPGQAAVQGVLLLLAFVSVPVMLFGEPCVQRARMKAKLEAGYRVAATEEVDTPDEEEHKGYHHEHKEHKMELEPAGSPKHGGGHGHGHDDEPFNFGDRMITQGIHTIEFVLGTVSNTASYLRLWALSLAHSELAEVFWSKMIMQYGIKSGSAIMLFVGFAVWSCATFAVLLAMDVLECFLHALRLHWVEFQNKFYHADGYAFAPFAFTVTEII